LAELLQAPASSVPPVDTLTSDQEAQFISDDKLLLVAVRALNHWSLATGHWPLAKIVGFYEITKLDVVKPLRILDRMGVIEFLPGDRIRRRAKPYFDWLPDGPIRRYFAHQALGNSWAVRSSRSTSCWILLTEC
jgi:hypothetical protein